jgi:hypothetical protein
MSDQHLRALERAFQESGSPEDEVTYLREVVRTGGSLDWDRYRRLAELDVSAASAYLLARVERGDLEQEKLELAAYCSHEPARVALGEAAPEGPEDFTKDQRDERTEEWIGLARWLRQLCQFGREVGVRACLAGARVAISTFEQRVPNCDEPLRALACAERALSSGDPALIELAIQAGLDADQAVTEATLEVAFVPEVTVGFAPTYCGLAFADEPTLARFGQGQLTDYASAVVTCCSIVADLLTSQRTAELISDAVVLWGLGRAEATPLP